MWSSSSLLTAHIEDLKFERNNETDTKYENKNEC